MELDIGLDFFTCTVINKYKKAEQVIKKGVNSRNEYGQTGIFFTDTPKILIENGADVNVKDKMGKTPLFLSNTENSRVLIQHGADVNAKNRRGDTPIFLADRDKMNILIESGADCNIKNNLGQTPLFYSYGTSDILIKNKVLLNIQDYSGKTPIFYSNLYKTKLLVEAGADIHIKDFYGQTALDYCDLYAKKRYLINAIAAQKILRCIRMFLAVKRVNYLRILPENLFKDEFRYTRMKIIGISDFWY